MNLNQDQVDTQIIEVSRSIGDLESRNGHAKDAIFDRGWSKYLGNHSENSHSESNLFAELRNPSQST